jgi:hypothetical protein
VKIGDLSRLPRSCPAYSPDDVDVGLLKKIVAVKLAEGLSPATVRVCSCGWPRPFAPPREFTTEVRGSPPVG